MLGGCVRVANSGTPAQPDPWPHERSDLKPDAAVVWGRLQNGVRYAIVPNRTPAQRASVLLLVQAGSFHERDDERGYAHFVEHMAFRDIRGFPGVSAWHALERLGAGPHVNADTGLFETKYYFHQLPVTDNGEPDPVALTIMRSITDGVEFTRGGVAAERGVVFAEMRSRDAMLARATADELEFIPPRERVPRWPEITSLFEGTRMAARHPLGEEGTLTTATSSRLGAFYDRLYRPDRIILVVAGDIVVDTVEQRLRALFSSLTARAQPFDEPVVPVVDNPGRAQFHERPEPATLLSLGVVRVRSAPDSRDRRFHSAARQLSLSMLVDRLQEAVETGQASFSAVEAFSSHYVPNLELVLVRARTHATDWRMAAGEIDLEVRRINEQGFTTSEFQRAAQQALAQAAAAARQARHRSSGDLATAVAVAAARGIVFTDAESELELVRASVAALDAAQCHAAFREMLLAGEWSVAAIGSSDTRPGEPVSFKKSRSDELKSYEPPPVPRPFPFTEFGPAGNVVRHERSAEMDADLIEFANGVRLNLKRTRFEPGQLRLGIRLDGGRFACPPDKPWLELQPFAWLVGGVKGLPPHELNAFMRGTLEKHNFSITPAGFHLNAQIPSDKVLLAFQLGAAFFSRPAFRAESSGRAALLAREGVAPYITTADGVAHLGLWHRMTGRHPAYRPFAYAEITEHTADEPPTWFGELLARAPLEIAAVGDFDPAVVIDACARTLGAMPQRMAGDPWRQLRRVAFPPAQFSDDITFEGARSVAVAAFAWPAPEAIEFPDRFRAGILAAILNSRVAQALRTELGETYSPTADFEANALLVPAVAFVRCCVEAAPERLDIVARATRAVAATLHRQGATYDELERVRQRCIRDTETGLRSNQWWLDLVGVAQTNPAYGRAWAGALRDYNSITLAEVNALAARVLAPQRCSQLLVRPMQAETTAAVANGSSVQ